MANAKEQEDKDFIERQKLLAKEYRDSLRVEADYIRPEVYESSTIGKRLELLADTSFFSPRKQYNTELGRKFQETEKARDVLKDQWINTSPIEGYAPLIAEPVSFDKRQEDINFIIKKLLPRGIVWDVYEKNPFRLADSDIYIRRYAPITNLPGDIDPSKIVTVYSVRAKGTPADNSIGEVILGCKVNPGNEIKMAGLMLDRDMAKIVFRASKYSGTSTADMPGLEDESKCYDLRISKKDKYLGEMLSYINKPPLPQASLKQGSSPEIQIYYDNERPLAPLPSVAHPPEKVNILSKAWWNNAATFFFGEETAAARLSKKAESSGLFKSSINYIKEIISSIKRDPLDNKEDKKFKSEDIKAFATAEAIDYIEKAQKKGCDPYFGKAQVTNEQVERLEKSPIKGHVCAEEKSVSPEDIQKQFPDLFPSRFKRFFGKSSAATNLDGKSFFRQTYREFEINPITRQFEVNRNKEPVEVTIMREQGQPDKVVGSSANKEYTRSCEMLDKAHGSVYSSETIKPNHFKGLGSEFIAIWQDYVHSDTHLEKFGRSSS